jgi:hypothetical protein
VGFVAVALSLITTTCPLSAACLNEPIEHFDFSELQSPVAPYENGRVQLRATHSTVADGKGNVQLASNVPELNGTFDIESSQVTITAYNVCPGSIINLVCRFAFREKPCVIAENATIANLESFLGVPTQPTTVQNAFEQTCKETGATTSSQAAEALTDTMRFMGLPFREGGAGLLQREAGQITYYAADNSRIMLCEVSVKDGCPVSRCDDIRVPKSRLRPRTLAKPEFVTRFQDGTYAVNNIGAPISDVTVSVNAVFYVEVGPRTLTYASATPGAPYQVIGGQSLFQIDLRPAYASVLKAIDVIRAGVTEKRVTLYEDICASISYKDPKGEEKSEQFSLRIFHYTPPRKGDMHAGAGFYWDCMSDYRKWKVYPKYFIENITDKILAERVIANVNEPVRRRTEQYWNWTFELQQGMEEPDDTYEATLVASDSSIDTSIAVWCQQNYLATSLGLWKGDFTGDSSGGSERVFQFAFDGKQVSYKLGPQSFQVYRADGRIALELLRSFLASKNLVVSFVDKNGKTVNMTYQLQGASEALKPVAARCRINN